MLALLGNAELADEGAPFFLNGVSGLASPFWKPDFESRFVGDGTELQQCRAVLESVAFLIKANLDEMDRHRPAPERLVASGGLAENRLLCRMLACLSGAPVDRGSDREATSRGLAFLVAGMPKDFQSPPVERFEPDADQRLLARYLKWLALMREASGT
jgi:glycerol kinase